MLISNYITPVMYSDITGYAPNWGTICWVAAAVIVVALVVTAVVLTGPAGLAAIGYAAQGIALTGMSTSATIFTFAAAGSAGALASAGIYAAISSKDKEEFNDFGPTALAMTVTGGVLGAYTGYSAYQSGLHTQGTYSTPETGRKGSTYTQLDPQNGNIMRQTQYGSNERQMWRIDYQGSPHYIKGYGDALPHIHVYDYRIYNEFVNRVESIYPYGN